MFSGMHCHMMAAIQHHMLRPAVLQGRVGVHHVEDAQQSKNFTFKCHRDGTDIYAVNAITFHPVHGTFVTAGSDGAYNFWDKVLLPPGIYNMLCSMVCSRLAAAVFGLSTYTRGCAV